MTYNEIIKDFKYIADNHKQIKRFGNGMIEDINTFTTQAEFLPVLWIVPQSVTLGTNAMVYTIRVLVFDMVESDDTNTDEVLSDTLSVLNDVVQLFKNNFDDYSVINEPQAIPFNQRFVDYCSGWYADVNIETNIMNSLCQIPDSI